jgi:hypothetical protein
MGLFKILVHTAATYLYGEVEAWALGPLDSDSPVAPSVCTEDAGAGGETDDPGTILVPIDQMEVLRSALAFYARPFNWQGRITPVSSLSPETRAMLSDVEPGMECDGEHDGPCPMVVMTSGPALDGGEHARFALTVAALSCQAS